MSRPRLRIFAIVEPGGRSPGPGRVLAGAYERSAVEASQVGVGAGAVDEGALVASAFGTRVSSYPQPASTTAATTVRTTRRFMRTPSGVGRHPRPRPPRRRDRPAASARQG